MVQKRPFDDEELYEISSKHPRQLEHNNHLISFLEFVPFDDHLQKPCVPGEGQLSKNKIDGGEKLLTDIHTGFPTSTKDTPGCISTSSWATSSTSEDDAGSEAPVDVPLFPEYFNYESPVKASNDADYYYLSLLDYPPRKGVPIGPDHQVDVPAWSQGIMDQLETSKQVTLSPQASGLEVSAGDSEEKKLIGTCVMPMPNSEPSYSDAVVGNGRTDCSCRDRGSIRCVRQHVGEAREKLKEALGEERFVKLGFCDMGEEVASKWNEEEEQLFNEVVFSNPVSLGKNFWDNLSFVFPSRTMKEIVSYYFNVFMLRKRAEQNRCDPENIDSDNDEWQETDDSCNDEHGVTEEDEDSVVESPIYEEDRICYPCHSDDKRKYKDFVNGTCGHNENVNSGRDILDISELCTDKLLNKSGSDSICQLSDKDPWDEKGDHDIQDGSCSSSSTMVDSQRTQVKAVNGDHWFGGHGGYGLVPCDPKVWDPGYVTCSKNEVDFLSTCSMIEEVFGAGTGTYKGTDGHDLI